MRVSKRFPIAVHALLLISRFGEAQRVTSDFVAKSTGTNAVTIRNIFLELKSKGIIDSSAGKNGGVTLARKLGDITLWDIYCAVETDETDEIFKFHEGSDRCPVGKNIYGLMRPYVDNAISAMKTELERVSLDTLMKDLQRTLGEHDR